MKRPIFAYWLIAGLLSLSLEIAVSLASADAARGEIQINDLIGAFTPAQSAQIAEAAHTARLSLVVVTDAIPFATEEAWKRWVQQHWVSADTITVAYHTTPSVGFIVVDPGSHVIISPQQVQQENVRLTQDASTGNLAGAIEAFCYRFRAEIEVEKRYRLSIQQAAAFAQRMQTLSTLLLLGGVLVVNILALLRWRKARKSQAIEDNETDDVILDATATDSSEASTTTTGDSQAGTSAAKPRRRLSLNRNALKRFVRWGRGGLRYGLIGAYILISAEYCKLTWSQAHDSATIVVSNGLHAVIALALGQVIARPGSFQPLLRFLRTSVFALLSGWAWWGQWWHHQKRRVKQAVSAVMMAVIQRLLGVLPRRLARRPQKETTQHDKNVLPSGQIEVLDISTSLPAETNLDGQQEPVAAEYKQTEAA